MKCIILNGCCLEQLKTLPDESVNCCVTSPPYWGLRDYGVEGQLGLEKSHEEYIANMVGVFQEVKRVLQDDGTLWLNIGDSYNAGREGGHPGGKNGISRTTIGPQRCGNNTPGLKPKDLVGIPWMLAFALRTDGWYLRQDIIWAKPNPMPESVKDRCTKSHEYIFLLSKLPKYYFDHEALREPAKHPNKKNKSSQKTAEQESAFFGKAPTNLGRCGTSDDGKRSRRSVWTVPTQSFLGAHFATFPPDLILPCILAGCPVNGVVLDPFFGAGTTGLVANQNNRNCIGIELNSEYVEIAKKRLLDSQPQRTDL